MPNVRASNDPTNNKATVTVGNIEIGQMFSVNVDTSDKAVQTAIADGSLVQLDNVEFDEDMQAEQLAAMEAYNERAAGVWPGSTPAEAAEPEVEETHEAPARQTRSRS